MSFRMSCFLVEMPANAVVKKNNKNEMSKTFFIFSSITKVIDYWIVYKENPIYTRTWFELQCV